MNQTIKSPSKISFVRQLKIAKKMKTLVGTNAELVKKVVELTKKIAESIEGKCTGELKTLLIIHY